jgi:membrane-associated phospholipid phosphatase
MARRDRVALPLLGLSIVSTIGFWSVYLIFVRTTDGQRIDDAALTGRAIAERGTEAAQQLLNTISVGSLVLAIALLAAQALVRRRPDLSLVAAGVIGGSVLAAEALKLELLPRPPLYPGPLSFPSFPSGHAAIAFAVGVAATLCVRVELRRTTALLAVLYGSGIAVATLAAGWHRPSDAAGSLLLVIAVAAAIAAVARIDPRPPADAGGPAGLGDAGRYLLAGIAALLGGWILTVAIVLASQAGAIDWSLGSAAFFGACAALVGLASVLMAGLLWGLRVSDPAQRSGG